MSHKRKPRTSQNDYHEQSAPTRIFQPPVPQPYPVPFVSVQVLHDKNASVANVSLAKRTAEQDDPPAYEYKASGSAKREPGDVHDEATAELLALSRAFQDLARQLERAATKRVRKSAKAQNENHERLAAKRAKAATPPVHRTLAEWEEIQTRAQVEKNAVMARNLGLGPIWEDFVGKLSTIFSVPPTVYVPRHVDAFLDNPESGVRRTRPAVGRHEKTYTYCPRHGYREALSVPGLTGSEPVCADCI